MNKAHDKAVKTTWMSIGGNAVLALLKGITGYLGNSYALIADAIESSSDVLASFLVLFGLKYASRPADENHPYGHGRAEPLVTFIVVGLLITSAIVIAYESITTFIRHMLYPPRIHCLFWVPLFFSKKFFTALSIAKAKRPRAPH